MIDNSNRLTVKQTKVGKTDHSYTVAALKHYKRGTGLVRSGNSALICIRVLYNFHWVWITLLLKWMLQNITEILRNFFLITSL